MAVALANLLCYAAGFVTRHHNRIHDNATP